MEEVYHGSYEDFEKRFGSPWYFSHRVDLHSELKRLALGSSGKFRGATLNISAPVTDVDCENGILKLEDGTVVYKDVIIGADGIHVRSHLIIA
jgi:salicylate hydroxylase